MEFSIYIFVFFIVVLQVDPCAEHKCRRGSICVANGNTKEGYSCRCKIGTKGRYCEQGEQGSTSSNPITGTHHFILSTFKPH